MYFMDQCLEKKPALATFPNLGGHVCFCSALFSPVSKYTEYSFPANSLNRIFPSGASLNSADFAHKLSMHP